MTWTAPKFIHFAGKIIAFETERKTSSDSEMPLSCLATEKLRPNLAALMGNVGYRSLLTRALSVSVKEHPWLGIVIVQKNGSFEGFDILASQVEKEKLVEGCIVILANLFGLLDTIIGEQLMLQLVHDVWPDVSSNEIEFSEGD